MVTVHHFLMRVMLVLEQQVQAKSFMLSATQSSQAQLKLEILYKEPPH
jgi:uncharacterized lipoprotein YajG